jgi:hypothetical protein
VTGKQKQLTGAPTIDAPKGMILTVTAAAWLARPISPKAVMTTSLTIAMSLLAVVGGEEYGWEVVPDVEWSWLKRWSCLEEFLYVEEVGNWAVLFI